MTRALDRGDLRDGLALAAATAVVRATFGALAHFSRKKALL